MNQTGISKLDLKRYNQSQIINLLRRQGPTSRVDISRKLQLTRAAVTIITNEMIQSGILSKQDHPAKPFEKSTRGRKKVLLEISPNYKFAFGAVINNHTLNIGLSNLNGDVLGKRCIQLPSSNTLEQLKDTIIHNVSEIQSESCLNSNQLLGLGLCMSAQETSLLEDPQQLGHIVAALETELHIKVVVESLTNALSLADVDFGYKNNLSKRPLNLVFLHCADDLAASMVVNDDVFHGSHYNAANLGEMLIDINYSHSSAVYNTQNFLNRVMTAQTLAEKINDIYSPQKTPVLYGLLGKNASSPGQQALHESALFADESIKEIIELSCRRLAMALINTIQIMDPERIVFFGEIFENEHLANFFLKSLSQNLPQHMAIRLAISKLQTRFIFLSGCCIAIRKFFVKQGGLPL